MSSVQASNPAGQHAAGLQGEVGEIVGNVRQEPIMRISRAELSPREQAISLPPTVMATPSPIAPLTRFLGPLLTVANPAWSGDPVPRMRGLQKRLVEHSLTVPESERSACMAAITVVEMAVQLRLRYQQMYMNEVEMAIKPEGVKAE
jgi:hypothetical protein